MALTVKPCPPLAQAPGIEDVLHTHYPAAIPTNLAAPNIHISSEVRDNVFRAGLNCHFSPGPPIVAASY
jgi:hypothetical protein